MTFLCATKPKATSVSKDWIGCRLLEQWRHPTVEGKGPLVFRAAPAAIFPTRADNGTITAPSATLGRGRFDALNDDPGLEE